MAEGVRCLWLCAGWDDDLPICYEEGCDELLLFNGQCDAQCNTGAQAVRTTPVVTPAPGDLGQTEAIRCGCCAEVCHWDNFACGPDEEASPDEGSFGGWRGGEREL